MPPIVIPVTSPAVTVSQRRVAVLPVSVVAPAHPAQAATTLPPLRVKVTVSPRPPDMTGTVEDGTVTEFALWNPDQLGYLAAYTAQALVNGDISGEEGDTFTAGELGEYTVGADGVVVLGDPFVFDAENVNDFEF